MRIHERTRACGCSTDSTSINPRCASVSRYDDTTSHGGYIARANCPFRSARNFYRAETWKRIEFGNFDEVTPMLENGEQWSSNGAILPVVSLSSTMPRTETMFRGIQFARRENCAFYDAGTHWVERIENRRYLR